MRWRIALFAAVVAALASVPLWGSAYVWSFASLTLMWVGLTLSWNLISGYTGYVSLGHTAFFGMGAYVGALLFSNLHVPWGAAAVIAGLVTSLVAAPLGYILLRLKGPFFAIGMLGLSEVFRIAVNRLSRWTGGGYGLYLETSDKIWFVYEAFLLTAVAVFVVTWIIDSLPYGRSLLAIRDDEEAAEVLGTRTTRNKVVAFIISAFFPGILGTTYAVFLSYIDPASAFPIEYNLFIVLSGALGGVGTVVGPVVGAIVIGAMRETFWISFPRLHLVVFGIVMVLTVLLLPNGIIRPAQRLFRRLTGAPDPDAGRADAAVLELDLTKLPVSTVSMPAAPSTDPLLRVEGVEKKFDGRKVVNGCSFDVPMASLTGLIGPNGSGKTTTFNLVNGLLTLSGGEVWFDGARISGQRPHRIADAGIGRTFQLPRLFDRLSVLDNMLVAAHREVAAGSLQRRAADMLELVGLTGVEQRPANKLSHGQRKLLEVARVLMGDPKLILMDEPFAGVNPVLRAKISDLVRALRERGMTFVIIGHEMSEMMALCDRMVVMDQGVVIRTGTPGEVQEDPHVFEAYFGSRHEFVPGVNPA